MDLKWKNQSIECSNGNMVFEKFDIGKYYNLLKEFDNLSKDEKKKYKGKEAYAEQVGGICLSSEQKNYLKLYEELQKQFASDHYFDILYIEKYSEKDTLIDLLSSLENINYIKKIYNKKKNMARKELNTDVSTKLMDCMRQGRSLLQSAKSANMLSKPLIDFYSASAFAFSSIVINSPIHKSLDTLKGSHGFTYSHINETIEFGGNNPKGTFIDLFTSCFFTQIVTPDVHFKYSNIESINYLQTHNISISLMALLSTVPELHNQVIRTVNQHELIYNLNIQIKVVNVNVSYVFEIGDGKHKPDIEILKKEFKTSDIEETNGKYVITIPCDKINNISPTIYQDIQGRIWYIKPLIEGLCLPEICLHFLIISALCNIMRYSPHEWNNILSNKISSEFSLLVSKYLRLFEIKYPMLLTQCFTNFLPIIKY